MIFTTKSMDDIAAKYLVQNNIMGLRRVDLNDLKRLARATGATIMTTLANNDGTESFEPELLGNAQRVFEENLGDIDYIFVEKPVK